MTETPASSCSQCGRELGENEGVTAQGRRFCSACYEALARVVREHVARMGQDVPYGLGLAGAIAGGVLGGLGWYLFTTLTNIAFGLIAIVIGIAVGKGALMATGGKRSRGLQIMSATISLVAYVMAALAVNHHYRGPEGMLGFDVMDLVFAAITAWEGWSVPRPVVVA